MKKPTKSDTKPTVFDQKRPQNDTVSTKTDFERTQKQPPSFPAIAGRSKRKFREVLGTAHRSHRSSPAAVASPAPAILASVATAVGQECGGRSSEGLKVSAVTFSAPAFSAPAFSAPAF